MLAFIIAGLVIVALISIFSVLIGAAAGAGHDEAAGKGIWRTLEILPALALPLAFAILIVFFILNAVQRSRANRRGDAADRGIKG
jgi:hypothetical protein